VNNGPPDLSWWRDESVTQEVYHEIEEKVKRGDGAVTHTIWCEDCNAKVLDVIAVQLDNGVGLRVIRCRSFERFPLGLADPKDVSPGEHGRLAAAAAAARTRSYQLGAWHLSEPYIDGVPTDSLGLVFAACKCSPRDHPHYEHEFSAVDILNRQGRKSTVKSRLAEP
jgi:hypothetical protein